MTKCPSKRALEGGFVPAHSFRLWSIMVGTSQSQRLEAVSHIMSTVREWWYAAVFSPFCPLLQPRIPTQGILPPIVDRSSHLRLHNHDDPQYICQEANSQMVLDLLMVAAKITRHIWRRDGEAPCLLELAQCAFISSLKSLLGHSSKSLQTIPLYFSVLENFLQYPSKFFWCEVDSKWWAINILQKQVANNNRRCCINTFLPSSLGGNILRSVFPHPLAFPLGTEAVVV